MVRKIMRVMVKRWTEVVVRILKGVRGRRKEAVIVRSWVSVMA
jgi:hypothetical protein